MIAPLLPPPSVNQKKLSKSEQPLNLAKMQERRKRNKRIKKLVFFSFFVLEGVFVAFFIKFYSKKFEFGLSLAILFSLINVCYLMIYTYIINSYNKPKNDPGIVIWWMCCVRVG